MKYGYARVSTPDQSLGLQLDALKDNGVNNIFSEKISGKNKHKPILNSLICKLKPGDQLIVWKLDRLGRRTGELIKLQEQLERRRIALVSLTEDIDTSSPTGKFVFQVLCSIAEMERNIISERTRAGLSSAKAKGRIGGRRPGLSKQAEQLAKLAAEEYKAYQQRKYKTIDDVCTKVGIARATLYKYLRLEGIVIGK
ncbi:recombinase family protein [Parabacteroides sp. APC149_11_2_Y6]